MQWSSESFSDWPATVPQIISGLDLTNPKSKHSNNQNNNHPQKHCNSCKDVIIPNSTVLNGYKQNPVSDNSNGVTVEPRARPPFNESSVATRQRCGGATPCTCPEPEQDVTSSSKPAWVKRLVLPEGEKDAVYKDTLYLMDIVVIMKVKS